MYKYQTHICAEISYMTDTGQIHSDLCEDTADGKFSEEHKAFLREAFDEFLQNFQKTNRYSGYFVVNARDLSAE